MSLLNQLFNRGIFGSRCKTCLTLAISRIKLVQNKRGLQLQQMCKEIAQFLKAGQEPIARIRVEHVIREQNMWSAYEILELFCEFVLARVPIIENEKECPAELREAISSIIFAAPKCSEVPELLQLKNLFSTKYSKDFIMTASELRPDSGVNRDIIQNLAIDAPSSEARLKTLKNIALDYNLEWNSSRTEAELFKRHEDLLGGSKTVVLEDSPLRTSTSVEAGVATNSNQRSRLDQPPASDTNRTMATDEIEPLSSNPSSEVASPVEVKTALTCRPSDVLDEARAAIAYADRAVLTARAAAELAKLDINSLNLQIKPSS